MPVRYDRAYVVSLRVPVRQDGFTLQNCCRSHEWALVLQERRQGASGAPPHPHLALLPSKAGAGVPRLLIFVTQRGWECSVNSCLRKASRASALFSSNLLPHLELLRRSCLVRWPVRCGESRVSQSINPLRIRSMARVLAAMRLIDFVS